MSKSTISTFQLFEMIPDQETVSAAAKKRKRAKRKVEKKQ